MSVLLPLTLNLAVALGIYAVAGSLGLLIMPADRKARLWQEMTDSPGLLFGYGALAFAVGATWIMVHHEWITLLGTIVSIAGWIIAVEGVVLLAFPALLVRLMLAISRFTALLCIVGIAIGLALIVAGMTGIANAVPEYMTTPV